MGHFTYQTVTPTDAPAWRDLRLEGVRDFPLGFLVTLEEAATADIDRCREILSSGNIRGIYIEKNLVGFCGYHRQQLERIKHRAEIGPFFVTQPYQGRGVAKAMMDGVISEAQDSGLGQLELFVDTENVSAIAFYERCGFERVATINDSVRIDGNSRDDYFYTLRF